MKKDRRRDVFLEKEHSLLLKHLANRLWRDSEEGAEVEEDEAEEGEGNSPSITQSAEAESESRIGGEQC